MGFLLRITDDMEVFLTEATLGAAKLPPGEGWNVAAVIEPSSGPPRFVWTRSKILRDLENTKAREGSAQ